MVPPVNDVYNQQTVLYRMSKVHVFDIRTFMYHVKMKMKKIITFPDLGKYDSSSETIVFYWKPKINKMGERSKHTWRNNSASVLQFHLDTMSLNRINTIYKLVWRTIWGFASM